MSADVFTALLLLAASGFTLLHVRALWVSRNPRGTSLIATAFFAGFCAWQAYNFDRLDQPASCAAALVFLATHLLWLRLQLRLRFSQFRLTPWRFLP